MVLKLYIRTAAHRFAIKAASQQHKLCKHEFLNPSTTRSSAMSKAALSPGLQQFQKLWGHVQQMDGDRMEGELVILSLHDCTE